jgi:hypothetical protein
MVDVPITIACGNYDRTRAIVDGRVKIEGCAVTYLPLYPEEIFHRAFKFGEFDVSELSFSSYLRTVAASALIYPGEAPCAAWTAAACRGSTPLPVGQPLTTTLHPVSLLPNARGSARRCRSPRCPPGTRSP